MCRIYRKYENSGWIFNAIGKNGLNGNAIDYAPIVEEIASILKKELKEYNKYQQKFYLKDIYDISYVKTLEI